MKYRESETVELKKSTSEMKEAVISVVSILNKHGRGKLYFGIRNDGAVVGQHVSPKTLRDVSRALSENIEPRIYPKVRDLRLGGKTCIKVDFAGNEAPYLAYGRACIRVGDENRQTSARELERMFLERNRAICLWEGELSGKRLSEINETAVRAFVRKANLAGRIDFEFTSAKNTLNKLGLTAGGKLLKAGEVLFCDDNSLEVQAAVFAATDKRTFLDIKQFKGNLFDLLKQSESYLKEHMDWRVEFGQLERKEIPEVPIDALREALVNSLCHRDYRNPKGNEVAIFRDRVEIYNPGDFPEGYKPEDFIKGKERSILRNPLIAETLYKSKDIERWGSGLKRITDECREKDVKVEFHMLKSGFLVIFHRKAEKDSRPGSKIGLGEKLVEKVGGKPGEKLVEKVGGKLRESQRKILELVETNPRISKQDLSLNIGVSTTAIDKNIMTLKARGLLRRVGPDKGGHWEVLSPEKESNRP